MKTVAIIQARTGSTRLPAKVLKPILGEPMLARMLERVKRAKALDTIVVATSDKSEDDAVAEIAEKAQIQVFRGSEKNVLDRYYKAAVAVGANSETAIVRLTGDCTLHDPAVIDEVVHRFIETGVEYTSTAKNYPEGLDAEVFSFSALAESAREATLPSEREHVTLYIKNHPELFKIDTPWTSGSEDNATMHWSVDTQADFDFVTQIFEQLYPSNPSFTKDDVLALLAREPELLEVNKGGTGWEGLAKSLKEDEEFKKQHDHSTE